MTGERLDLAQGMGVMKEKVNDKSKYREVTATALRLHTGNVTHLGCTVF
jgi:hypothetical protein